MSDLAVLMASLTPEQRMLFLSRLNQIHTRSGKFRPLEPLPRQPAINSFPLSYAQERLWFIDQWAASHPLYNISGALHLIGSLNVETLRQSLNEIVRRHEILRTTFTATEAGPIQVVSPVSGVNLPVTDLSDESALKTPWLAQYAQRHEAQRPFSLARGPLLRLTLLRLREQEHLLLVIMHHIVSDGWSLGVFIRELVAHYEAFYAGEPTPLPDLSIQYADFAVWQRESLQGYILESQVAYWKRHLAGAPAILELPTDRPRPAVPSFRGGEQSFTLPLQLVSSLKVLSQAENATLFMTLLAAFNTLLYRVTKQRDILIGIPVANRNRAELEGMFGFFVNTLVVRTDLTGEPTFRETVGRVRQVCMKAYANQDAPFEKIVQAQEIERSGSYNPLFQVMFNHQSLPLESFNLPFLAVTPLKAGYVGAKFDLSLQTWEGATGLNGSLIYNTDIFDASTATGLLQRFEVLLSHAARTPDTSIDALDILPEAEKAEKAVQDQNRKRRHFQKLVAARRKPVSLSQIESVSIDTLTPGEPLPLVIRPGDLNINLAAWIRSNRELIDRLLKSSGAILLRNFNIDSLSMFETVTRIISPVLIDYHERTSPRTEIGRNIYTSTEYPAEYEIPLHNELAYSRQWPMKLWFYCRTPAREGGETPLADSRRALQFIGVRIRKRFERKKIMYVRNFNKGIDLPWQEVFQTADKAAVEEYCQNAQIEFEWKGTDRLRLRQVREAVISHPITGEPVWFNQVALFHPSGLAAEVRDSLLSIVGEEDLPKHCYYGDGSLIETSVLEEIRLAYRQATVTFPWQAGDILMVDNMLVAHGRRPFIGSREVFVAMAERYVGPVAAHVREKS